MLTSKSVPGSLSSEEFIASSSEVGIVGFSSSDSSGSSAAIVFKGCSVVDCFVV